MIQNGFTFIAFLMFFAGIVIWLEAKYKDSKFFKYVPAIIIIYFTVMLMSTFHVWDMTDSVKGSSWFNQRSNSASHDFLNAFKSRFKRYC